MSEFQAERTPIDKVYEKFKHMDALITDERFHDIPQNKMLSELWEVIKDSVGRIDWKGMLERYLTNGQCPPKMEIKGKCLVPETPCQDCWRKWWEENK